MIAINFETANQIPLHEHEKIKNKVQLIAIF